MAQTISGEERHAQMTQTPIPKLVTALSLPTVFSQLITVIYNTADTWFVSQISTGASAAVGVAFSLMSIIQACGYGIGMGANSLISRRLGQKKEAEANRYASSGFFLAILVGAVIGALSLAFLHPLMRLLGSTDTMMPYSVPYAKYILMAAPVSCASFVLNNILRSEGESKLAMWGLCTGGILNVFLDYLFVFRLEMGTAGAAIATILGQAVSFCILLSFFLRKKSIVRLSVKYVSLRPADYGLIVATGFPTVCRQGLASLASALLNRQAAVYGDAAVAAVTISNKVYLLIRNIVIGIGQGFQPVAGYNYGAGDKKRTKQAFTFAVILGTVVCVLSAAVIACVPARIIEWFRDDPEVIEIGKTALLLACAVMPLMALSTYVNQLYQTLGFKLPATLLAACRQGFCFLPLVFTLPRAWGLFGVQLLQPAADFLTFLICVPALIYFLKKHLR